MTRTAVSFVWRSEMKPFLTLLTLLTLFLFSLAASFVLEGLDVEKSMGGIISGWSCDLCGDDRTSYILLANMGVIE